MLTEALPTTLDVRKAAARGVTVKGAVAVAQMARLRDILASDRGSAEVLIAFSQDEEKRCIARISVQAELELNCQRCLESMSSRVSAEHTLGIVGDDELAGQLPRHLEPWVVQGERADLWALVEDELMLGMPIVSLHETEQCRQRLKQFQTPPPQVAENNNPFQVLQQLKSAQN